MKVSGAVPSVCQCVVTLIVDYAIATHLVTVVMVVILVLGKQVHNSCTYAD